MENWAQNSGINGSAYKVSFGADHRACLPKFHLPSEMIMILQREEILEEVKII
jgi:hypothetical protein